MDVEPQFPFASMKVRRGGSCFLAFSNQKGELLLNPF